MPQQVSLDIDALIAACQGAAWKISGWPYNIATHYAKGCACCHKYINHLLGAQSLGQINLLCPDMENAVQSTWPAFINSIEIDANECIQGQISNLHVQIDELKGALRDAKKSYCNAEAVGAHMLICIYAQSQSKCISVFSLILLLHSIHFTICTL